MRYILPILALLFISVSCNSGETNENSESNKDTVVTDQLIDSLRFTQINNSSKSKCESGVESELEFISVFPSNSGNDTLDQFVRGVIINKITENFMSDAKDVSMSIDTVEKFRDYTMRLGQQFYTSACSAMEEYEMQMGWILNINTSVEWNSNGLLCLEFSQYSFSGGAHGNSSVEYKVINLRTIQELALEDILIDSAQLIEMGEKYLRKKYEIPTEQSLVDGGFDVESFPLTENFGFTEKGFVMLFNPYDIAPYAMGTIEIIIPYSELEGVIKMPNSKEEDKPIV